MSTVAQILARAEKLNNYKTFVVENPEVPLATAIAKFYGPIYKNSDKHKSLMRLGVVARQFPDRFNH